MIRRLGGLPVFEDLTPEQIAEADATEQAIATQVVANEMAAMENRRVVALLTQRGYNPDPAITIAAERPVHGDVMRLRRRC